MKKAPPGGFARHAEEQAARWQELTPEQRLRWLERAKRFARKVQEAPLVDTGLEEPK